MSRILIATAVLTGLSFIADGDSAQAGHCRNSSGISLGQLVPQPSVSPSSQQYSQPYHMRSHYGTMYYDPSYRLRYGFGGYPGNYYRDPQGFFSIRSDSRYWFGIHR